MIGSGRMWRAGIVVVAIGVAIAACQEKKTAAPADTAKAPAAQQQQAPAAVKTATAPAALKPLFQVPPDAPPIIARVGTTAVSREQLEDELRRTQLQYEESGVPEGITRVEILRTAVNGLTERELRIRVAQAEGIVPDPKEIEAWVARIETQMAADPGFRSFLIRAGNTRAHRLEDGRYVTLMAGLAEKIGTELVAKTSTSLKAYYDAHPQQFQDPSGKKPSFDEAKIFVFRRMYPQAVDNALAKRMEAVKSTAKVEVLLPELAEKK